ncbi:hypothetical protein O9992_20720 [Vibrio lentus]|nr:hypothetical protein [Vibrio lentus]
MLKARCSHHFWWRTSCGGAVQRYCGISRTWCTVGERPCTGKQLSCESPHLGVVAELPGSTLGKLMAQRM